MQIVAHDKRGPIKARVRKNNYYFPTREAALAYAELNGLPTARIIEYQIGWAIQKQVSGPYAGPNGWS